MVDIGFTAATSPLVRPSRNTDEKDNAPDRGIFRQLLGLGRLKPYLWPAGNIGFKVRSVLAVILTIISKFVIVGSPFFPGHAIDQIKIASATVPQQISLLIFALVLGYGGLLILCYLLAALNILPVYR